MAAGVEGVHTVELHPVLHSVDMLARPQVTASLTQTEAEPLSPRQRSELARGLPLLELQPKSKLPVSQCRPTRHSFTAGRFMDYHMRWNKDPVPYSLAHPIL
eukprot:TRINITY_DN5755_c0_g1_i3.p1 TRINITY_DN5755_c0_g1~~TRINITY_DN5755_c0_g1_i3.p1  ORF type:complete len:102 (+),score=6.48 TRINITY_DN5755_c0_g1_i3:66-371(+)